jgi:hypothetical protein
MRGCALLRSSPRAPRFVCALGFGDDLVGGSHECDHPEWVKRLPALTEPKLPTDGTSYEIDQRIKAILQEGVAVYRVFARRVVRQGGLHRGAGGVPAREPPDSRVIGAVVGAAARKKTGPLTGCGRDTGYPAPPAQPRTCSFPAPGFAPRRKRGLTSMRPVTRVGAIGLLAFIFATA